MLPGGARIICVILDVYYTDVAQDLRTAGEHLDYVNHDLS